MKKYTSLFALRLSKLVFGAGLSLAATSLSNAAKYYVTPTGDGSKDGSNFCNAMSWDELSESDVTDLINGIMEPGDTLYMGSGDYDGKQIDITSSGSPDNLKRIVGRDTGGGQPMLTNGTWSESSPGDGTNFIINFKYGGESYWEIKGLDLKGSERGIYFRNSETPHLGIVLNNINISYVRYGVYAYNLDDSTLKNVSVKRYTKVGFYIHSGCDSLDLVDCYANMSDGLPDWIDYSERFVCGFRSDGLLSRNTNVTMKRCVSLGNQNESSASCYWNGDGFVAEYGDGGVTTGNIGLAYKGCIALDNDDGGYDIKSDVTFVNCVAFRNKRNYRVWYSNATFRNCIAGYPFKRGGCSTEANIWLRDATVAIKSSTLHADDEISIDVQDVQQGTTTVSIRRSILSNRSADGVFVSGDSSGGVRLHESTVTFSPGNGEDPDYVNDHFDWAGFGDDFNSRLYGSSKGYFQ